MTDSPRSPATSFDGRNLDSGPDQGAQDWSAPTELPEVAVLPPFPVDALTPSLAQMVEALGEFAQTDPAMPGAYLLAVLAAAVAGRVEVEVRPGWREPAVVWIAVVAAPGERKSAVASALTAPLLEVEHDLVEETKPVIVEKEATRAVQRRRAERAQREAGKEPESEEQKDSELRAAIEAAKQAEECEVPAMPRLIADDVTPEAAISLMAENGGRLAILTPEGGILDIIGGRYDRKGAPNLDAWLKGHAGDPIRVDRKSRPPEYVRRPALAIGLMAQPAVLDAIGRNEGLRGRGLLARFLYALPEPRVGRRQVGTAPVPDRIRATYDQHLRTLAATLKDWAGDPAIIVLTPEANQVLLEFERRLEPRLGPSGDLGAAGIADFGSKAAGATARIALLLHLADDPTGSWRQAITGDVMKRAVEITETFFIPHARDAFERMSGTVPLDDAWYLLAVLRHAQLKELSVRDLFTRSSRSRFRVVDDLRPAVDLLEDHGWIARLPDPEKRGPGRPPSPRYRIHPKLVAETAESRPR